MHPNIQRSCRKNVVGRGPLSSFTVASSGVSPWPKARYQSCSAWSCSSAKNSMAGTERKATSIALGLHCLCIRVAGSSFLFLVVRGVIASTNPNRICRNPASLSAALSSPIIAMSLPVPTGLILWWCAWLSSRW